MSEANRNVFDVDRIQRQIERIVWEKLKDHPEVGKFMATEPEIEIHGKLYPCTTVQFDSINPKT